MTRPSVLALLLLCFNTFTIHAFTLSTPTKATNSMTLTSMSSSPSNNNNNNAQELSRREAFATFNKAALAAATVLTTSASLPANADVTNKIASSSALRTIKRCIRQLTDMEGSATSFNDYMSVKESIRKPPLTEVRRNCVILIKGGEDGPDAALLQEKYNAFIKALESLDGQASLGMRGRKGISMVEEYDATMKAIKDFYEVAERTAEAPIQYAD
uniref:Uncharacterized protein n=1 Tax=Ditylum brightwellii TaxID=49249 RepID=A0A7S1Z940_9STRA|mmetsp:Transcript_27205/g.40401  ORF Transcript_27205/g.40401 Transcript_27205/m.40401 type:complete len:215 (+) Transcript_27205:160-804(+)